MAIDAGGVLTLLLLFANEIVTGAFHGPCVVCKGKRRLNLIRGSVPSSPSHLHVSAAPTPGTYFVHLIPRVGCTMNTSTFHQCTPSSQQFPPQPVARINSTKRHKHPEFYLAFHRKKNISTTLRSPVVSIGTYFPVDLSFV